MADEWRDDGYAAPSGDWPGGHRYGVTRERFLRPYVWSDADRELAARHGITLPDGLGRVTVETWRDQPREHILHIDVDEAPPASYMTRDASFPTGGTARRWTKTARRYQRFEWDYDPLRALRTAVRP